MKRMLLLVLALGTTLSFAQNITFRLDMNEYSGPSFTKPEVNGDFNGWCGNCNPMTDADMDGIWETTIDLTGIDSIEFKFSFDTWTGQESLTPGSPCTKTSSGFTNRFMVINGDETLDAVCWESCFECGSAGSSSDVTFRVDMSDYSGASYSMVNLNGTFNGWCGTCTEMTDADNDMIYEVTVNVPNDTVEYKFTLDGWDVDEQFAGGESCTKTVGTFTNRMIIPAGDTMLTAVCWNSCDACGTSSINESVLAESFMMSPNPTNGTLNVSFSSGISTELTIHDLTGKQVFSKVYSTGEAKDVLQLNDLQKGMYIISLASEKNQTTKRLVIQ